MNYNYKTLIADDDPEMRDVLRGFLEELGCTVDGEVENGRDAVKQISLIQPKLCFIDIEMPIKNGLEVLEEIKALSIKTFPIIVSGHSTIDNVKLAVGLGAKGFIVKPYEIDKVKQILEKYSVSLP